MGTVQDFCAVFDKPLGLIYEKSGIIDAGQVEENGRIQSELLALRDALYDENNTPIEARIALLPKFKNKPDLAALVTDPGLRTEISNSLALSIEAFQRAQDIVNRHAGVNPDLSRIPVPLIGFIHEKKANVDPGAKNAALTGQSLARLLVQVERLTETGADLEKAQERIFHSDRDPAALQTLQQIREGLLSLEKIASGDHWTIAPQSLSLSKTEIDVIQSVPALLKAALPDKTIDFEALTQQALDKSPLRFFGVRSDLLSAPGIPRPAP